MAWRFAGLAMAAGLLLAGCTDEGTLPIYVGDNLLTTVGGPGPAATSSGEAPGDRPTTIGLGSIFASGGTPVYIGGRRVNCPAEQLDC